MYVCMYIVYLYYVQEIIRSSPVTIPSIYISTVYNVHWMVRWTKSNTERKNRIWKNVLTEFV